MRLADLLGEGPQMEAQWAFEVEFLVDQAVGAEMFCEWSSVHGLRQGCIID